MTRRAAQIEATMATYMRVDTCVAVSVPGCIRKFWA
jgi:hypothetical protein